jgi:hypothetical protein
MAQKKSKKRPGNQGGMAFGRNLKVLGTVIFAVGAFGTFKGACEIAANCDPILSWDQVIDGAGGSSVVRGGTVGRET